MTASPPSPGHAPFRAEPLFFHPLPSSHEPAPGKEAHGRYMLQVPWSQTSGWGQPRITPRTEIPVDPLSGVTQYAVTCFEGMKCYKTQAGELTLFRPKNNFDRFKVSAARMGLPSDWDNDELLSLLCKLLALEAPIVPSEDGASLYIRPTLIETSESFGIKEDGNAGEALMYIVTTLNLGKGLYGSVEAPERGLRLDADPNFVRAWTGGTGKYKVGANYGTVNVAKKPGFQMSLWLHGKEDFISEAGAMNVFILKQAADGVLEFVTMSLDNGIVLPGITRASLIAMLQDHGSEQKPFPVEGVPTKIRVVERDIPMSELVDGSKDGSLKGMFGCGTGVVVVSIQEIQYRGSIIQIPNHPVTRLLRDAITGIQRGRIERDDWLVKVPEWKGVKNGQVEADGQKVIA